jgi:hypothetical protein
VTPDNDSSHLGRSFLFVGSIYGSTVFNMDV